jgi:hypothetical protein
MEFKGLPYGAKEMEFERVETLPSRVPVKLEIAAGGIERPHDEEELRTWRPVRPHWEALGWSVVDAHEVSASPQRYRHYIQRSRGEFAVAKNVYVATRSGWFSCRSVCYLAAGLPVVVQDTGFSDVIPCGEGVLAFSTLDEATDALRRAETEYPRHQAAARRIAQEHFSSERVVGAMLATVGLR